MAMNVEIKHQNTQSGLKPTFYNIFPNKRMNN